MVYILTLFLWVGGEWTEADPNDFPPQTFNTAKECFQQEFYWNKFYGPNAEEYIGVNRAVCVEKNAF